MEKEPQPESLATVAIKPDYPPSEVYGSEPPPAYHRSQSSAVQIAKIIAVTVVIVSFVLGGFILASAYVTANASCRELREELELLSEAAERLPLQPEALIQERNYEPEPKQQVETTSEKSKPEPEPQKLEDESSDSSSESDEDDDEEERPIHIKLPLQLDFDDLAGALMEKNQKSRMNCMVEKKRAEEVVDHKPKTVSLPFGLNLTTDPRYERVSGERMVIFCESGNYQRHVPPAPEPEQNQEETIMIQPVMIPLVGNSYATHMPQQMAQPQQQRMMHPMEAMRPPMMQQPQPDNQLPPASILHHIAQQIIAQRLMESQREQEEAQNTNDLEEDSQQQQQQQPRYDVPLTMGQRIPIPEEVLTQINRLPNRDMIVVQEQEQEEPQEVRIVEQARPNLPQEMQARQGYARGLPVHIPVPMMQQEPQQQQQQQEVEQEEVRPHYVQPRSVRSVDAVFKKEAKRVKRCACDCAC